MTPQLHASQLSAAAPTLEQPPPLERFAVCGFRVLLRLAPSYWLTAAFGADSSEGLADTKRNRRLAAVYVVIVTAGLIAMLLISPSNNTVEVIFAALAAWRLLEIFTVGLGIALRQENSLIGYSLVTVAFWGFQVSLILAILDHSLATTAFVLHESGHARAAASRPFEYFYISATQMVTLGNAYDATTDLARILTMAASLSGASLLAIFVASALTHDRTTIDRYQLAKEVVRLMREAPPGKSTRAP
jgi:hypothetical protein